MPEPAVFGNSRNNRIFAEPVEQVRHDQSSHCQWIRNRSPGALIRWLSGAGCRRPDETDAGATATLPGDDRLLREFLAGAGINDPVCCSEQWSALMRTSASCCGHG